MIIIKQNNKIEIDDSNSVKNVLGLPRDGGATIRVALVAIAFDYDNRNENEKNAKSKRFTSTQFGIDRTTTANYCFYVKSTTKQQQLRYFSITRSRCAVRIIARLRRLRRPTLWFEKNNFRSRKTKRKDVFELEVTKREREQRVAHTMNQLSTKQSSYRIIDCKSNKKNRIHEVTKYAANPDVARAEINYCFFINER